MALTAPRKKNLYRPFNVCSELVIHEYPEGTTRSVCPHCKRKFCAKNWERRVKTRCWKSLPRRRGGGGVQIAIILLKEYLGAATSNAGVHIVSVTNVECKVQIDNANA
ncbi:hypothetical protein PS2_026473 [Malus domestica]